MLVVGGEAALRRRSDASAWNRCPRATLAAMLMFPLPFCSVVSAPVKIVLRGVRLIVTLLVFAGPIMTLAVGLWLYSKDTDALATELFHLGGGIVALMVDSTPMPSPDDEAAMATFARWVHDAHYVISNVDPADASRFIADGLRRVPFHALIFSSLFGLYVMLFWWLPGLRRGGGVRLPPDVRTGPSWRSQSRGHFSACAP